MSQPALERLGVDASALERWLGRGRTALDALGTKLARGARQAAKRVASDSPVLRHGLAALERGNLEAAFWLLREEVARQPDASRAVQSFWDVAVACGRAEDAAGSMSRLLARQATEQPELAAASWIALDDAAPDAPVDALTLARILPALKARLAAAADAAAREAARAALARALRRCVEPGSGLAGGVALRVFEEARELEPAVARRAAEIALASPHLHEAKRARLEAHVAPGSAPLPVPGEPACDQPAAGLASSSTTGNAR